jgi:hypothetical protein
LIKQMPAMCGDRSIVVLVDQQISLLAHSIAAEVNHL